MSRPSQSREPQPSRADVYQRITDQIVAAIEAGAEDFKMPWHVPDASSAIPVNAATDKAYRGINILTLWAEAHAHHYPEAKWATYLQWQELGYQVRKGEKSATGVLWKPIDKAEADTDNAAEEGNDDRKPWIARAFPLFNIAQTEGYVPPSLPERLDATRIAHADDFMATLKADIRHGGHRAYYRSSSDHIQMPPFEVFCDVVAYYTTLAHEATHWTGHPSRLNRDLNHRFGTEQYAAEELVAELGAAFIAADLGLSLEPKSENAAYISNWLSILEGDKRAIFTAASHAQRAADYLHGLQAPNLQPLVAIHNSPPQLSFCV